jgi:peptide/nickel transport system substrate-binding protein
MKKFIYILLITMFFLSGCVVEKKYISPKTQDYILCSFGELPTTLDMPSNETNYYLGIYSYLFEGLVHVDRKGVVKPGLAEDWSVSDDGIEYSFNIRGDAKWSDGTPITADDFVSFFKYILSKGANNPSITEFYPVFGVEDYNKGKIAFGEVAIKAVEKNKLEIRLNHAYPEFLEILSRPRNTLRKSTSRLKQWMERYKEIKYSGPFIVESIDKAGIALVKNENYWQKDYITDEKFLITTAKSKEEALADFEGGKLDIMRNPPINEISRIISSDNTIIVNSKDVVALVFNNSKSLTEEDINFRREIVSNIDVEQLTAVGLKEFNPLEYGIFKTVEVFNPIEGEEVDNENKEVKKSLMMISESNDINKRISSQIEKQLEEKLGVQVKTKYIMTEKLKEEIDKGEYDLLLQRLKGSYTKEYAEFNENENLVFPLFNCSDVIIRNDYIEGIEIDSSDNIILNNVYQR